MPTSIYTDGTYLARNPTWSVEDSSWKATNLLRMIDKHQLQFTTYAEIGCGGGRILKHLAARYPHVLFHGYDISPQAINIARQFEQKNLEFFQDDILKREDIRYDLVALIDVIEHVEDYMGFLRSIGGIGTWFLFVIPLEITVSSIARNIIKDARESVGHIHYFMKDTALATLSDTGFEVIDWCYGRAGLDLARKFRHKIAWLPRKVLFTINKDACARFLGGFPMIVLARRMERLASEGKNEISAR